MPLAAVYPLVTSRAVARVFTYEVPEEVGKGAIVQVRLGRSTTRGVVVELGVEAPPGIALSPVGGRVRVIATLIVWAAVAWPIAGLMLRSLYGALSGRLVVRLRA